MSAGMNYKHLYYFWVVAKEGGMARAADRLGMAVQTVSSQVRLLEQSLGHSLLKPLGRGLTLTEAGQAALTQAEQIFQLGEQLPQRVADAVSGPSMRLAVGMSDGLPKLVVRRLLQPVVHEPQLRLLAHEDRFDNLLAALALHRLDVVLADRVPPPNPNLKLYSHALGASGLSWYGADAFQAKARKNFPRSLAQLPVLLPTAHTASRALIDQWLLKQGITPHIVGEFEDSALLKTFGASGMGVFPAADWVHEDLLKRYGVKRIGGMQGVEQHFFAVGTEKRVAHPLVQRLLTSAS
jgi:LysR family transcriptional regulator, transcriptional activator of nhaA